ncbi:MAG: hypothetical protein A2219_01335 [Elusimicrobia bacterium RIFOXYA2_FULL_50_26]|nr:MAG: hypothetical protein A2219_01335 [Elusimicrobia bacterium RIFOXYA2_FULL_50_26]OGS24299.1 MAG: hypothetical protein A2314_07575 [Elusimicrobia bacterium RIFOXYB2_FULL_50_12]
MTVNYKEAEGGMKMKTRLLTLACCLSLSSTLFAAAGTTGAQFLKINPSARAAGMAGAFSAVADDVFAIYANPAGLSQLKKAEIAATYISYFADVKYGFIGYASQVRDIGVFGFGYTYLLVDQIEKRDVDETKLGDFNAKDTSITVAYGRNDAIPSVMEGVSVGGSLKVISSEIDQTIAYTGALDLAAMFSPAEKFKATLAIQNISAGIKFKEVTDKLPLNVKLGAAYEASPNLTVAADIDEYLFDNKFYGSVGGEYLPVEKLALRAGYRIGYDTASLGQTVGLSIGFGVRIWSAGLDYAFVPFGDLGDTHRVSFLAKF